MPCCPEGVGRPERLRFGEAPPHNIMFSQAVMPRVKGFGIYRRFSFAPRRADIRPSR